MPEDYEFGPTTPSFAAGPIDMHKELAAVAKGLREGQEQLEAGLRNNIAEGEKNQALIEGGQAELIKVAKEIQSMFESKLEASLDKARREQQQEL